MTRQLDHAEAQELLGAYALDAVEDEERRLVAQHLGECSVCRAEVDAHLEAQHRSAWAAAQPPEELWNRISGALDRPAQARRSPGAEHGARRDPMRSKRRSYALRAAGTVAALAAVAAIVVLAVRVVDQSKEIDKLSSSVAGSGALSNAANVALADGRGERVVLRSDDGALDVDAVLLRDGTGYIVHDNLEPLPPDRTYQLWAIVGDRVISAGILGANPGISAFHVDGPVSGLVVTEERKGGVVSSKNPALAAWLQTA